MQDRQLIVISGNQQAGIARAEKLIRHFPANQVMHTPITTQQALGKEYQAIIYNTYQGFDPDVLGAIGGAIVAGGVLILVTPPLHNWPQYNDPFNQRIVNWPYCATDMTGNFIRRFVNKLRQTDFVIFLSATDISPVLSLPPPDIPLRDRHFRTTGQQAAIKKIIPLLHTNTLIPIVIEADRGRGKSALLGMIATELSHTRNPTHATIHITAPSSKAAAIVFKHTEKSLQKNSNIAYIAPDQICLNWPPTDLLIVDEAAAIPAAQLTKMLRHYSTKAQATNIIFATTVHGYEGTGRGFALRFKQQLDHLTPAWQKITLEQPIRYATSDPLEAFLFDSLLLNAKPVSSSRLKNFTLQNCTYKTINTTALSNNEALLREIFGLLVLAHYQTRPTDLRHLLDGINLSISVITWRQHVIATALCVQEGGFNKQLAHEIHYGTRRPRGHLVPQSLAVHAGLADAPRHKTQRIMRIVVHPHVQRQGVARLLLQHIKQQAQQHTEIDYLSSSFAATPELLEFWNKQGYKPVRIGFSRDTCSGSHSVIVMQALSQQGKILYKQARHQLQRYLPVHLSEPLSDLENEIITALQIVQQPQKETHLNQQDYLDILSFAEGMRGYESCMLAVQKLVYLAKKNPPAWNRLTVDEQTLLIKKTIEQQSWDRVVQTLALAGKKQAKKRLREVIQKLISLGYN